MKIGNISVSNPVILAPMSGVTDKPFRRLVRKFGAPLLVTEMVASKAMIIQTRKSMQRCELDQEGGLTSVQLAGCEPSVMAEAAKMNEDFGAKIIDINFGCPAVKVAKKGYAGSHLMRDEKLAVQILKATVEAVDVPVTLKMRLGWDEENKNAPKLAKIAEDLGIQMITVHGRTRQQFYRGKSDWEYIKRVKDAVNIPVIVNGDIKSFKCAQQALEASNANGVMIGRGCYGKPWLISQVADQMEGKAPQKIDLNIIFEAMLEHFEGNLSYYGAKPGMMISRKHLAWYTSGMRESSTFRSFINQADTPKAIIDKMAELKKIQEDAPF